MAGKSLAEAQAIRYLIDVSNDELMAELALDKKIFEQVLFHLEQACEKGAKACLTLLGIVLSDEHRYVDYVRKMLIPNSGGLKNNFLKILPEISLLESFYVPTRYGVDKTGQVHLREKFEEKEMIALFNETQKFINLCFLFIEKRISKTLPKKKEGLVKLLKEEYSEFVKIK